MYRRMIRQALPAAMLICMFVCMLAICTVHASAADIFQHDQTILGTSKDNIPASNSMLKLGRSNMTEVSLGNSVYMVESTKGDTKGNIYFCTTYNKDNKTDDKRYNDLGYLVFNQTERDNNGKITEGGVNGHNFLVKVNMKYFSHSARHSGDESKSLEGNDNHHYTGYKTYDHASDSLGGTAKDHHWSTFAHVTKTQLWMGNDTDNMYVNVRAPSWVGYAVELYIDNNDDGKVDSQDKKIEDSFIWGELDIDQKNSSEGITYYPDTVNHMENASGTSTLPTICTWSNWYNGTSKIKSDGLLFATKDNGVEGTESWLKAGCLVETKPGTSPHVKIRFGANNNYNTPCTSRVVLYYAATDEQAPQKTVSLSGKSAVSGDAGTVDVNDTGTYTITYDTLRYKKDFYALGSGGFYESLIMTDDISKDLLITSVSVSDGKSAHAFALSENTAGYTSVKKNNDYFTISVSQETKSQKIIVAATDTWLSDGDNYSSVDMTNTLTYKINFKIKSSAAGNGITNTGYVHDLPSNECKFSVTSLPAAGIKINKKSANGSISDITFTVAGTNKNGEQKTYTGKTDANGVCEIKNIDEGEYNIIESEFDKSSYSTSERTMPDSSDYPGMPYKTLVISDDNGDDIISSDEIKIGGSSVSETTFTNIPFKFEFVKYAKSESGQETKIPVEGAEYELRKGTNGSGEVLKKYVTDSRGYISDYIKKGKFCLVETKAPDGYLLDKTPIIVDLSSKTSVRVTGYDREAQAVITATKKVSASQIDFAHGTPTFIFKLKDISEPGGIVYIQVVSFSSDYVKNNTDSSGYVSKSVSFTVPADTDYLLSEQHVTRYENSSVTDITDGKAVNKIMSADTEDSFALGKMGVKFNSASGFYASDKGSATFVSTKDDYSTYSDTALKTNAIK